MGPPGGPRPEAVCSKSYCCVWFICLVGLSVERLHQVVCALPATDGITLF